MQRKSDDDSDDDDQSLNSATESDRQPARDIFTEPDDEDDKDDKIWGSVLYQVLDHYERSVLQKDKEGLQWNKKKFLKGIRDTVESAIETADAIQNTTMYEQLEHEKARLKGKGYSDVEAMKLAWYNRRHLVKESLLEDLRTPNEYYDAMESDYENDSNVESDDEDATNIEPDEEDAADMDEDDELSD